MTRHGQERRQFVRTSAGRCTWRPEHRQFTRTPVEGRCSDCGDFGLVDLNIQRCEACAALLRSEW